MSTMTTYVIRVRTPGGFLNEVSIRALSYAHAASQAAAFGQVCGLIESRSD